jgi:DNA topoisomerase-3
MIREYNWLDIYPYEKWTEGTLPEYNKGEKFRPSKFEFKESTTSSPKLLSENELITLMDKNGIGTDATIHEHIKTI